MARKRVVSRTVKLYQSTAIIYNRPAKSARELDIYYPTEYDDNRTKIREFLVSSQQIFDYEDIVEIYNKTAVSAYMEMPEYQYITSAKLISIQH